MAAKEKASYLVETLGNTLGDILSISELNANTNWGVTSYSNYRSNSIIESDTQNTAEIEKKIKLRYEIQARFKIK